MRRTAISIVILGLMAATALAQSAANTAPLVTARSTGDHVRFTGPSTVTDIKVELITETGVRVFEGSAKGNILDWAAASRDGGQLTDGDLLAVVSVTSLSGKISRRIGAVNVQSGRAKLAKASPSEVQKQLAGIVADEPAITVLDESTVSTTTVGHNGIDGQITATTGDLTLRTGDVFAGTDSERVRVTADGKVGIGTSKPEADLDVAGTLRVRKGITIGDVVLRSNDRGALVIAGANGSEAPAIGGTGTANRIAKWIDGAGTLGDTIIAEANNSVGVNTSTPGTLNGVTFNTVPMHIYRPASSAYFAVEAFGNGSFAGMLLNRTSAAPNQRIWVIDSQPDATFTSSVLGFSTYTDAGQPTARMAITRNGNVGIGTTTPAFPLTVNGVINSTSGGFRFPDGTVQTTAANGGGGSMTGTAIVSAINDAATTGVISEARLSQNVAKLNTQNAWTGQNTFVNGLSANGVAITNVGNPVSATDAVNKAYADSNFVKFVPGAEQLSVGDANGTAPMINLRGGSTCCSGPGGHTPAWFKVFQNGSFVATGNLGIGVSPMQGKGYRTSWDSYKGAFRSGYADAEWDDANVGFFSWAGGSNSTAIGLYALAFGDTNSAESTSSIVFGSGNQVKGAAGFSAGAGNRVCDTYGVALGNNAKSGGPLINGKCDPDSFNIRGLAAVAIGYNVTADQDHTTAMGKFASNNGFTGTFVWSDGSATASADTFRNTANNEFAARATGGFRFRTNLAGTTGCNLPAGSGVFNCTSSRTTKENFTNVSSADVLSKIRKLPVSTWNYIAEGQQSRHLGPMAEDFYKAFGLGVSDKSIGIQDLAGVSLAGVKALEERTADLQTENAALKAKLAAQDQKLDVVQDQLQKQQAQIDELKKLVLAKKGETEKQ